MIELTQSTPPGTPRQTVEENHDSDSPTASGSTTPTKASVDQSTTRKSRAFLDLSPLTGFWRGRPSSISTSTSKSSADSPEATPTATNGTREVEDVAEGASAGHDCIDGNEDADTKIEHANGHASNGVTEEKYEEEADLPTTPGISVG